MQCLWQPACAQCSLAELTSMSYHWHSAGCCDALHSCPSRCQRAQTQLAAEALMLKPAAAPSIADRFKAAYDDRALRKAVKAERNRRQAYARSLRASGSVARAIALAEAGVKLHT